MKARYVKMRGGHWDEVLSLIYKKLDNKSSEPKMETLRLIEKYQINSIKIKWEEMAKTKVTEISKLTLTKEKQWPKN